MSKARQDGVTGYVAVVATGVRGDVLQHVALAVGLRHLGGFKVKLVTHAGYAEIAASHGLEFFALKGDPSALISSTAFRQAVDSSNTFGMAALLTRHADSIMEPNMGLIHDACKSVDGIVCSISVLTECLAIGQKYQKPVILAPLLPYSPSGELPLPSLLPKPLEYAFLNKLSYDLSGTLLWGVAGPAFNRFRTRVLGLGKQAGYVLDGVPQVAAFSTAAVPRPSDWGSHVHQTSHWVLPEPAERMAASQPRLFAAMQATAGLDSARRPIVVSFEGLPLADAPAFLRALHKVATKAGVRAVFLAGASAGGDSGEWSALRSSARLSDLPDLVFDLPGVSPVAATAIGKARADAGPPRLIVAATAPYSWLFPQASTIIHHGGALVTQAAWASGVPAIAFPAFGDQWFWAARTAASGIGPAVVFPFREASTRLEECVGLARSSSSVSAASSLGAGVRGAGEGVYSAVMLVRDILSRPQHRHCGVTCAWMNDDSRLACSMCEGPFTLVNRRHHCRSCGRLACSKCLVQRCHLPGFPEDAPQLTCTTCLDHRRAFFAMHVGESAVPALPAGVPPPALHGAGAGQAGAGAAGLGSPVPRAPAMAMTPGQGSGAGASMLSPGTVAASVLSPAFNSIDLVSGK